MSGKLLDLLAEAGGPSLSDLGQPVSAFDAARVSRNDAGFLPAGLGPNAENEQFGGLSRIWARSTFLHDNNELVDAAAEADIDRVIQTGLDDLQPDTGDTELDDQISALYQWAFEAVDPDRSMSLAQTQALYWRERRRVGECGVRVVMAEAFGGYPMMPAIELIEAERIPESLNGVNPETGNPVRQGVEYDEKWRIVAYHVLVHHPRDGDPKSGAVGFGSLGLPGLAGFGSPSLRRVPATEMRLSIRRRRIRQLRGVPDLVSAMRTIRREEQYVETQMGHAITAASIGTLMPAPDAAMFRPVKAAGGGSVTPALVDGLGNPITTIGPGGVGFYNPASKGEIKTLHANLPGPQFAETVRTLQRRQSRGLNGSYSQISGDYSTETFASNRANRIDQRQRDLRNQQLEVWKPLVQPFLRVLLPYGLLSGRVTPSSQMMIKIRKNPEILYRTNVPSPGEAFINPKQEADAMSIDLASGIGSQIDAIGSRGGDWKRVVRNRVKYTKFVMDECAKEGVDPAMVLGQGRGDGARGDGRDGQDGRDGAGVNGDGQGQDEEDDV